VVSAGKPVRIVGGRWPARKLAPGPVSSTRQGRHHRRAGLACPPRSTANPGGPSARPARIRRAVDDLAALSVAADEARSNGYPHAELVLIDSGLDDRGARWTSTVPACWQARPGPEVVRQLTASGRPARACAGFTRRPGRNRLHRAAADAAVREVAQQRSPRSGLPSSGPRAPRSKLSRNPARVHLSGHGSR